MVDVEVEPAIAAAMFGEQIEQARAFTADLGARGEELGLIGPLEPPRIWTRHVLNSALVAPLIAEGARVGDVGSGGGLPGLVLAIARPDAHFTLIEPMERRTDWLSEQVDRLSLANVDVLRVEGILDQVTARAVSALSKLIPMTAPLLRPGGELILLKGERVAAETEAASKVIRKHRLRNVETLVLGDGMIPEVTRVFRATVD